MLAIAGRNRRLLRVVFLAGQSNAQACQYWTTTKMKVTIRQINSSSYNPELDFYHAPSHTM